MLKIVLLGTGNVARHLFYAFGQVKDLDIIRVVGRNKAALKYFEEGTETSSDYQNLPEADIYIIAVSDDAISTVSEKLMIKNKLVVHTSGSVGMNAISDQNRPGVFYPLQTFSNDREVNFQLIPICVEAGTGKDIKLLKRLANALGDRVYEISTEQRRSLHVAAVFVNNFSNHLFAIGSDLCQEIELPFSILQPLIQETCNKLGQMSPLEAQTGPARRKDRGTINRHLQLLSNERYREIYSLLSRSIQETYEKEL